VWYQEYGGNDHTIVTPASLLSPAFGRFRCTKLLVNARQNGTRTPTSTRHEDEAAQEEGAKTTTSTRHEDEDAKENGTRTTTSTRHEDDDVHKDGTRTTTSTRHEDDDVHRRKALQEDGPRECILMCQAQNL
jgi:hypothetical protein